MILINELRVLILSPSDYEGFLINLFFIKIFNTRIFFDDLLLIRNNSKI
jgi:hypothetical protein